MPCDLNDAVGPAQVEQHSQDMAMAAGALRSMTEEKVALEKRLHRLERQVLLAQACICLCLLRVRSVCSHPETNWHIMCVWGGVQAENGHRHSGGATCRHATPARRRVAAAA